MAYAVLDYVARTGTGGNTITLSRLAHEPGGPGRAFKLAEAELLAVLEPTIDANRELGLACSDRAPPSFPGRQSPTESQSTYSTATSPRSPWTSGPAPMGTNRSTTKLWESLGLGRDTSDAMRRLHAAAGPAVGALS